MWLLDVNLPTALTTLLQTFGVVAETAAARGWRQLTNGELARAASRAGFSALLTRDRAFGAVAANALDAVPDLSIVIVTLPQAREAAYLSAFELAWRSRPIQPIAGAIIEWP